MIPRPHSGTLVRRRAVPGAQHCMPGGKAARTDWVGLPLSVGPESAAAAGPGMSQDAASLQPSGWFQRRAQPAAWGYGKADQGRSEVEQRHLQEGWL